MPMPKADESSREFFTSMVPDDPSVTVRPMFGNLAAFVNGNMFLCLLGAPKLPSVCPRRSVKGCCESLVRHRSSLCPGGPCEST